MLIISRCRIKEHVRSDGMAALNQWLDGEFIPVYEKTEGVNSIQAYNSNSGDLIFVADVDNYATVDNILANADFAPVIDKWFEYLTKIGEDILLDRPVLQGFLDPD